MQIYKGHLEASGRVHHCSLAVGNFDGVHRGHQTLVEAANVVPHRGPLCVLTFDPHPAKLFKPQMAPLLISPLARRLELLAAFGVEVAVVERFDRAFAGLSAAQFVDLVLLEGLQPDAVTVGYDFTYGSGREGSAETLSKRLEAAGVEARVLAPVDVEGLLASSTRVREFVLGGQMEGAQLLLGRPFSVWGKVIRGAGRGSGLGIRTLNLETEHELLPRRGVYATWTVLPSCDRPVASVTNVGRNPTFGDEELHIETHVLEQIEDCYDDEVEVRFVLRLREERRFPDATELVAQIQDDIARARSLLAERTPGR